MPPTAATITISETLALLDGPFERLASGVADGKYALWLGSGISFGRVEGLKTVVQRVIEFLRRKIDPGASPCRFREALNQALDLASPSTEERTRFDFERAFEEWPDAKALTQRLIGRYSQLLDIAILGEEEDFLLWEGARVTDTYADPNLQPDVEHLCIALLMLEGVVPHVATANWDGLIERAAEQLSGSDQAVRICVSPAQLRDPARRSTLYKFHGCAILAANDPAEYRPRLVARQSQIVRWLEDLDNAALINQLVGLTTTHPTLMMGMSAQDVNIQGIFARAEQTMPWGWPDTQPALVFSTESLGADHRTLLKNVYRTAFNSANRDAILASAHIRAYAKPLLVALVLAVLCLKYQRLVELAPGNLADSDLTRLKAGVSELRNMIGDTVEPDALRFVHNLIRQNSRAFGIFLDGALRPDTDRTYVPAVPHPLHNMATDAALPLSGLRELGVLLGILGLGLTGGVWKLDLAEADVAAAGTIRLATARSEVRLLMVDNSFAALRLMNSGDLSDDDPGTVVVHCRELVAPMTRSPRSAPGRTGIITLREISIFDLLAQASSLDDLMQLFREEIAA